MFVPYNFDITDDGAYCFTTSAGLNYESIFFEDDSAISLGIDIGQPIHQFSFFPIKSIDALERRSDIRIQHTIIATIIDFYSKNPSSILLFLCLEDDRLAISRLKLFKKWFSIHNYEPLKTMFSIEITDVLMVGLLIDTNHPKINEIVSIYKIQIEELEAHGKMHVSTKS